MTKGVVTISKILHIRLDHDIRDIIDQCMEGRNMTDKARNFLSSPVLVKQFLVAEKAELATRLKNIDEALKSNIFVDIGNLTKEEQEYLKGSLKIMNEKGIKYLYGRCEGYNRQFSRHLTTKDFRLLLNEFKNGRK